MENSNKHQGELSLLEMMQNVKSPDGRRTPELTPGSASMTIALNEEKKRRQECERVIQQLQNQISVLQQELVVSESATQRKDALLMQAQQHWKTKEVNYNQELDLTGKENARLVEMVSKLEEQIQISMAEARKSASELQTVTRKHDAALRDLKEENVRLKEKSEQIQSQLHEITVQFDNSQKEVKRIESKLDESKRENHRLKSQVEDLKREKNNSEADLGLLQERYESSRHQWETHCQSRVQEATQNAEEQAERQLKVWQTEVESKLRQLVSTLELQLGMLKSKNLEEAQITESRHQAEIKNMRSQCALLLQQVQQQKKEHDDLTRQMRELVEAQWNTVNRIQPFSGARQKTAPSAVASEISDATLLTNDSLNTKTTSTLAKRDEMHQYVSQVIQRHAAAAAPPPTKVPNERRDPASRRKT